VTIELIRAPATWRATLDGCRATGQRVGLVLTMGALHAGHLSLIRRAAADCDAVAVTDYVNPLQFGPNEDLAAYPRSLDDDRRLAGEAGAHLLFAPTTEELWAERGCTTVAVPGLSETMEGASRPGHFDGVATIVTKLFALSGPCWSYFGEKDFQQLAVIRRLVSDLSLPVEVVGCPIVRDPDGLALSSRNAYLTAAERAVAPRLYYALLAGKRAVEDEGIADPAVVTGAMAEALAHTSEFSLDYAEVVDPVQLTRPPRVSGEIRVLMAARLGRTRLIDNVAAMAPDPTEAQPAAAPGLSAGPAGPGLGT
jgi:pantoate--beta-alanine ligase